jgi:hypothetical protein
MAAFTPEDDVSPQQGHAALNLATEIRKTFAQLSRQEKEEQKTRKKG